MQWSAWAKAMMSVAALFVLGSSASVQAQSLLNNQRWTIDSDVMFLKLHSSVGFADENTFDFDTSEKIAVTYLSDCNVGVRGTWFSYDHQNTDPVVGLVDFETYNIDLEVFKRVNFTSSVIEISAGLRHNGSELDFRNDNHDFYGTGGLFGIRGGVKVRENGLLFSKAKFAVLMGDGRNDANAFPGLNVAAREMVRSQTELGFGYEHRIQFACATIIPHFGAEWQIWDGYAPDPVDEHPESSLGLFGFFTGLGINF